MISNQLALYQGPRWAQAVYGCLQDKMEMNNIGECKYLDYKNPTKKLLVIANTPLTPSSCVLCSDWNPEFSHCRLRRGIQKMLLSFHCRSFVTSLLGSLNRPKPSQQLSKQETCYLHCSIIENVVNLISVLRCHE